jgi:lipopolysaccharide export system protein LptA
MKRKHNINLRSILTGMLCLFGAYLIVAQNQKPKTTAKDEKKKTKVELLHAMEGRADQRVLPDAQTLIGDVRLRHDSMYMYCDSALVFEKTNSVEAYGNVRMEQGDTLFIYGDYLYYDGVSQLAQLRENVKMINRNTTLLTDSLNYDRIYDLGYFFEGGTMMDEENVLTSDWGEYSPTTKDAVFNHDVKLVNPKFILTSDTLKYNTASKLATILGPSEIVNDENHIYSERGTYNTNSEQAELLDRSVLTNEGRRLTGDSLFYDRKKGYGEAFDNVVMNDTVNKSMLTGDYCFYNELTDSAFATKRAVAIDYSQGDSLFLHADTLMIVTYNMNTDSVIREMRAFHKVRLYRTDVQGVCDSLVYNSKDSCATMYVDPVLWNENQQLLGEEIKIYMNDSTIDWAHIINQALAVEQKDSLRYNQITGREMKAYFEEGEMRRVEVIANLLMVYYPEESDGSLIGMDYGEGSLLHMFLREGKMKKAIMIGKSNGVLYPLDQIPAGKDKLTTFVWLDNMRPKDKEDIFNWVGKSSGQVLHKSTRKSTGSKKRDLIR